MRLIPTSAYLPPQERGRFLVAVAVAAISAAAYLTAWGSWTSFLPLVPLAWAAASVAGYLSWGLGMTQIPTGTGAIKLACIFAFAAGIAFRDRWNPSFVVGLVPAALWATAACRQLWLTAEEPAPDAYRAALDRRPKSWAEAQTPAVRFDIAALFAGGVFVLSGCALDSIQPMLLGAVLYVLALPWLDWHWGPSPWAVTRRPWFAAAAMLTLCLLFAPVIAMPPAFGAMPLQVAAGVLMTGFPIALGLAYSARPKETRRPLVGPIQPLTAAARLLGVAFVYVVYSIWRLPNPAGQHLLAKSLPGEFDQVAIEDGGAAFLSSDGDTVQRLWRAATQSRQSVFFASAFMNKGDNLVFISNKTHRTILIPFSGSNPTEDFGPYLAHLIEDVKAHTTPRYALREPYARYETD